MVSPRLRRILALAMRVFLSHNRIDKEIARSLGAYLVLAGADVWFDEWQIQAGDSIPGKLNEGLAEFDVFILLWSEKAARSNWVRREFEAAIHRVLETGKGRVIPCQVDDTPLPPLIRDIRAEDLRDPKKDIPKLIDGVLGFRTRKDRMLAIQEAIDEMDFNWVAGISFVPLICCPKCGAEKTLEAFNTTDRRGDRYEVVRCGACGWSDANEL